MQDLLHTYISETDERERRSKEEVEEKYRVHGVSLKECVEENQGIYRERRERERERVDW